MVSDQTMPRVFSSGRGRFEISTHEDEVGSRAVRLVDQIWRHLGPVMSLPEGYTNSIILRIEDTDAPDPVVFTRLEPGGLVSVLLQAHGYDRQNLIRAMLKGILLRQAIYRHARMSEKAAPAWLVEGLAQYLDTLVNPAMFDAWQLEAKASPPPLTDLFAWDGGADPAGAYRAGSLAILYLVKEELGNTTALASFIDHVISGDDPAGLLVLGLGKKWPSAYEREVWWRTGYVGLRVKQTSPVMSAEDSRLMLRELNRIVLGDPQTREDHLLSLDEQWADRADPVLINEVNRKLLELEQSGPRFHPFYINAAQSLGERYLQLLLGDEDAFRAARDQFADDVMAGRELETTSTELLDKWETSTETLPPTP